MLIENLMEKAEQGQYRLLSVLQSSVHPLGLKEVGEQTGLSRATLVKYIEAIQDLAKQEGFPLELFSANDELTLELGPRVSWQDLAYLFLKKAIKYQILIHVFKHHHFSINYLAQELLVSEATLNRHLAKVNQLLSEFDLNLTQGSLKGSEHQIRYFFFELFWQTWPSQSLLDKCQSEQYQQELTMVERLCQAELTEESRDKLYIWLYISRQRLPFVRKDFSLTEELCRPYQDNAFYQRIDRAVLRYLSHYAFEFSHGESQCLFMFLVSQSILPNHTMAYMMGFGGPIVLTVTQSIQLLKEWGLFKKGHQQVLTYSLGQILGQAYFFKGGILQRRDSYRFIPQPIQAILPQDAPNRVSSFFKHLSVLNRQEGDDLALRLSWHMSQLLTFLLEKRSASLKVALDIAGDPIAEEMLALTLRHYLDNNQLITLEIYDKRESYDYIVSNSVVRDYGETPVYRLKDHLSDRDMQSIVRLLKEELGRREEQLSNV